VHRLTKTQAATRTKRGPIEASEDDGRSKKGGKPQNDSSLSAITSEQIQELIANAVKIQLGVGSQKSHLYSKPYTKRIDALRMPYGY